MTKKIEYVAYVQTGKVSKIEEYEDDETDEEIIERFNEWVCEVSYAAWAEID